MVAATEEAEEEEEAAAVIVVVITKTPAVTSVKTWIISSRSTPDIESVTRITGRTQVDIREAVVEIEEAVVIEEIPAEIIVRITVKVMARIMLISSRNILVKGIPTEVTIGAVVITIRTEEKVAAEEVEVEEEEAAESRVVGTKVAIIRIATNVVATTEVEVEDNTEVISRMDSNKESKSFPCGESCDDINMYNHSNTHIVNHHYYAYVTCMI